MDLRQGRRRPRLSLGPDSKGRCHVSYECQPGLKVDKGKTKGRSSPHPSIRGRRSVSQRAVAGWNLLPPDTMCAGAQPPLEAEASATLFTAAVTVGILLMALCGPFSPTIISPVSC